MAGESWVIGFEEYREISMLGVGNRELEEIFLEIEAETGNAWDYKKEKFVRYRMGCFLSEERKEG